LEQTVETCRHFYNSLWAGRRDAWEDKGRTVTKGEQLHRVKELKRTNPYAAGIHSHILQVVVSGLNKAFQAFFRRVQAGEKAGYPRFKGRFRYDSFGMKKYGNGSKINSRRLRLSGIGRVAVRWHRLLEGKLKTVRTMRTAEG